MANDQSTDQVLRVSNTSSPADLASAISYALYDGRKVILRAIGAGAVNQAVKGVAIARGYVAQRSLDLACAPGFTTVKMNNRVTQEPEDVSAIVIRVFTL